MALRKAPMASSPSNLPEVLPLFTYDYKELNKHRETRGSCLFVNSEYIEASVLTCLRKTI